MGVWALQGVMAFVVLAISIDIINKQNDPHTTFKYNAFTGGLGILVVALGLASSFFDAIPSLVVMAADAVSGVLLLGGGIAIAIGLRGINCDPSSIEDSKTMAENPLMRDPKAGMGAATYLDTCRKATAIQAMSFVTLCFALATFTLVFLGWRKGRSGGRTYS
ncbi:hypothetical protein Cob_v008698 [Colletotrichum orbiculare MAFF 240422]|uniref:Uncharacterized protein n=2 Tax=Colletotrichum orbiculare species complex TaxID=2707354 RepID=N4V181_COLOR|nr:hypothetical protein Cob_v008698 [Colletotrichum orbiculare MAFF 240422]TDZ37134.1 hypothetical protein C8035_v008983 [Colletotrichum spinosum]